MKLNITNCGILTIFLALMQCSSFFSLQKPPVFKTAIAISFKELTKKVKSDVDAGIPLSKDLAHFCGINRLYGYALDEKENDIILIGGRMEPSNDITMDDFVVSLRNAWLESMPPGCSIDPRPQEMDNLKNLMQKINKHPDEFIQDRILSKWKKSAEFESVRILGIPKNTSFAKAIVDADYIMKKISDGTYPIMVKGFKSFNTMMLDAEEKEFKKNGSLDQKEILCRFWFYPDDNEFSTTTNALYLKNSSVKLLTEEEYWNENGAMTGKGTPHPVAQEFVKKFTNKYRAISDREPVYAQLETLFRLVVIQKLLKEKNAFKNSNLDFWLKRFPLTSVETPDSLRAIYSYKRLYSEYDRGTLTILSPMAGGVTIAPELSEKCFKPDTTGFVADLRNVAIHSRPANESVYWFFDLPLAIYNRIFGPG